MYHLTIHTQFAAAHNLIHYQGDCENLHGHNWKVEATVCARELDRSGLAIDFKILKRETKRILELLDHKYLNEIKPFDQMSPSSENISRFIYEKLSEVLNNDNVRVERITVWESDNACASYTAD
ncbi:6-carboxytetrahydropterin synthase QueD [Geoalkalibacter sp.]|uniref:6-carboxytetrahydropterin synthase QueD n=1 Tax=Geoalkalibacter sp. TaxID=3041440 RepID=UPI00272DD745|nr:6-carboxytetrahydropterin synthase QueD [Geoalkalibacter sp.]